MPVKVTLDAVLTARAVRAKDVAELVGISETQLSLFRSGKVRGVRFATIARLCFVLGCQPGDLLHYDPEPDDMERNDEP
jgi:putative transcriptional regulator